MPSNVPYGDDDSKLHEKLYYAPAPRVGALGDDARLTSV